MSERTTLHCNRSALWLALNIKQHDVQRSINLISEGATTPSHGPNFTSARVASLVLFEMTMRGKTMARSSDRRSMNEEWERAEYARCNYSNGEKTMQINAWATKGPNQPLEPYSYDPGPLAPDDVEIAVETCGLCHSDVSVMNNEWGDLLLPGHSWT